MNSHNSQTFKQGSQTLHGTAIGLPISWGGARGVNGAAYMAVPWSVWEFLQLWDQVWREEGLGLDPFHGTHRRHPFFAAETSRDLPAWPLRPDWCNGGLLVETLKPAMACLPLNILEETHALAFKD